MCNWPDNSDDASNNVGELLYVLSKGCWSNWTRKNWSMKADALKTLLLLLLLL